ncbi:hypothetical protein [Cellulomonas sp. NPDC089187]|uniref:hypothetical protein n=1 Tax=Cellulomonas sp. NPDC089187 TaxID=3154970 RepID=UPI00342A16B9
MTDYLEISPANDIVSSTDLFRFTIDGERFELPALMSADIPLGLIPVVLTLRTESASDSDTQLRVIGAFVGWLQEDQPKLWQVIKRQQTPLAWVGGLLAQWAEHSRLDPTPPVSGR